LILLLGACGFHPGGDHPATGGGDDVSPDAPTAIDPDAPVTSAPIELYAASMQMLHRIDIDHLTDTLVGPIAEPNGTEIEVAGLAYDGSTLLGLTPAGAAMIRIDPATGTMLSKKNLTPVAKWGGLTVIPAGELEAEPVVLTGNSDDGKLFRINAGNGVVTAVGSFGANLGFFSDLAWVHGQGLFATLQGTACTPVCFAKIDPTTGAATIVRSNVPNLIYGLSGYRGKLWAFNGDGPLLEVSMTSWLMTIELETSIHWTEAAQ
jgi:hypothetical protein